MNIIICDDRIDDRKNVSDLLSDYGEKKKMCIRDSAGTPQTGQGHLRRRAAVSGLLGTDGFLKWQAPDPIPDGI